MRLLQEIYHGYVSPVGIRSIPCELIHSQSFLFSRDGSTSLNCFFPRKIIFIAIAFLLLIMRSDFVPMISGTFSVVKDAVHIAEGTRYACKVFNYPKVRL